MTDEVLINAASSRASSDPFAGGPNIVDYEEWSEFYYSMRDELSKMREPARSDVTKMVENTQAAWITYSAKSLEYKKHQPDLYEKFIECKKMAEKFKTMAFLKGMHW